MTWRTLHLLMALGLLGACSQTPSGDQDASALRKEAPVRLTRSENGHVAEVALRSDGGALQLTVTSAAGDRPLPMARRIEMWKPLLEETLNRSPRRDYLLTVGQYPELSERIAGAAACSGRWNLETGAALSSPAGAAVAALMTSEHLYPEVSALTESLGYRASVSSVESVVLCAWKSVGGSAASACARAIDADAKVPCGASIVFRISPEK